MRLEDTAKMPVPPQIAAAASTNGKVSKKKDGKTEILNDRKTEKAGGTIATRILRYLTESHSNGDPDCSVDEVFRVSGAASADSTSACLVELKRKGLVQAGSQRGKWQISKQGLEYLKQRKKEDGINSVPTDLPAGFGED